MNLSKNGILIKSPTIIQIFYYMPDYTDIIQEFVWQTDDIIPEIPRIHKFLNYWHKNIDATIAEIIVSYVNKRGNIRVLDNESYFEISQSFKKIH